MLQNGGQHAKLTLCENLSHLSLPVSLGVHLVKEKVIDRARRMGKWIGVISDGTEDEEEENYDNYDNYDHQGWQNTLTSDARRSTATALDEWPRPVTDQAAGCVCAPVALPVSSVCFHRVG